MPAVLSFLGRVGLNLLRGVSSFLLRKGPSYLSSGIRSLSNNLQRRKEEKEQGETELNLLQALGLIKKPSLSESLSNKLRADLPLSLALILTLFVALIALLGGLLGTILIPASSLVTSGP